MQEDAYGDDDDDDEYVFAIAGGDHGGKVVVKLEVFRWR